MSDNSTDKLSKTIIQIIEEEKPQSVKQLMTIAKERLPLAEEKILEAVQKLQSQGKIRFESPPLAASLKFAGYLKTSQAFWYWATVTITTVTVAIVFAVPETFYPWSYLRNGLGALFVLGLPGYSFTRALFPANGPIKMPTKKLEAIERIALSVGVSLALVPIIGLLLYYTPWGINLITVVPSLFALTLIFATAALVREHKNA